MTITTPALYGQVLFGRSLYGWNTSSNIYTPTWTPVQQDVVSGIWTEVPQF